MTEVALRRMTKSKSPICYPGYTAFYLGGGGSWWARGQGQLQKRSAFKPVGRRRQPAQVALQQLVQKTLDRRQQHSSRACADLDVVLVE